MKEKLSPIPHDQWEDIPSSMTNLFEEPEKDVPMDGSFDFAALDALLGEETSNTPAAEEPEASVSAVGTSATKVTADTEETLEPSQAENVQKKSPAFLRRFWQRITGSKKSKVLTGIAAVLLLLLTYVAAVLIGVALDPYDNRILENTTIGSISVGGLTRSEAYRLLKEETDSTFTQQSMEIVLPDATLTLSPEQTKASFSPWAAVTEAFRLGRKGTTEENQAAVTASQADGNHISMLPYLELDQTYIRSQLEGYAAQYNIAYTEATYQLTGTKPSLSEGDFNESAPGQTLQLTMGTPLVELDVEAVLNQVLEAYSRNSFTVIISAIPPTTIPQKPDLDAIYQETYIAPVDAGLDMVTYAQISGSYGYALDLEAAKKLISAAGYGETVTIPMVYITPEILGDAVYFRDELGYCETPHTNNENRNTNLRLACEALDGYILQPGEEFSYNGVLGERTAAKGYKPAPAYSGTDTVNSIGGGVCQGSSTLYYAALVADLEIVERINHGFRSTYIPIGLDATVSWNGPDFKFRNSTHFPIMIKAEVSDGYMRMWIYGTDEKDYYVILESKITGISEARYVSKTVPAGSGYYNGQLISGGTDGYYAQSYSCKYDKDTDELISRDPIAASSYMRIDYVLAKIAEETP